MRSFFAALTFLTPFPLPKNWINSEEFLKRSVVFFPIVGICIGAVIIGADWVYRHLFEAPFLTSALAVLTMIITSKALHLDGLSDTFDALLSSRSRERMLEIMKDSRVGSMGVLAITGVILIKWSALVSLPGEFRWQALLLMPLAGRSALVFQMAAIPYARGEGGLATVFKKGCGVPHFLWALVVLTGVSWFLLRWTGLLIPLGVLLCIGLFSFYCHRKIGGFTGDTLGAGCELMELVPPLILILNPTFGGLGLLQ